MIDSIKKDVCTGCKMCGDICPTVAIKFKAGLRMDVGSPR